jgi:hypothetical protein
MKAFNKIFATVFTNDNGSHKVMLPSGEIIPHDVKSVTIDQVNYSEVTLTFVCNITKTKEEALEQYNK